MDSDDSPATPCTPCAAGMFWTARSVALPPTCEACTLGRADTDGDSLTPCTACPVGTYGAVGSAICADCELLDAVDHDNDPSTPCMVLNHCDESECPTCPPPPPVVPCPAPAASSGRRRQLQPVEAAQSLLPFLGPLLAVMGIAARVYH
jgi:hypothetical protein